MNSEGDSTSAQSAESDDPAWDYNHLEVDDSITCLFCNTVTRGGISVAKQHLIGGNRNVKACSQCPQDVIDKLKAHMARQKSKNKVVVDGYHDLDIEQSGFQGDNDEKKISILVKKRNWVHIGGQEKRMKSIDQEEFRAQAIQAIARFFYEAGISLHAARAGSFKKMIKAIGRYGPDFKPPSYRELSGPLLKKEVENINQLINGHKEEWSKYGCSIMLDGWSDRERRTTINVLVNSSKGTVFMESINASSIKSRFDMSALLDRLVEKIGEANVVQVITDNRSSSVLAGKMLMVIRQNLFWTPCVAHSIDLMLEDIGNIAKVKTTIKRGIFVVGYIYNDYDVLNMMKEFTENKELPRTGITRFVTTYLTLQSLHKQKGSLKNMFTSEKWTKSVWAKEAKGKRASEVVSMPSFWKNVLWTLKVMGPLVRILRLVKNEKKPAMGYIYKATDRAKEAIRAAFDKDDKCKAVYDIIDKRWECQLNHPLHAAGYYLNPELYCTDPKIEKDSKVMKGLLECIEKLKMNSEGDSTSSQSAESDDPAWEYNHLEEDDSITCLFCNTVTRGGISVAKQHLTGGNRNVKACSQCPQDVIDKLKAHMARQKSKNKVVVDGYHDLDIEQSGFQGDNDEKKISNLVKKRNWVHIGGQEKRMKSIDQEEFRAQAIQAIARFFYEAGISLHAARAGSFKKMIKAIGRYGPDFKPPSYRELSGPLLKKEVENINQLINGHKEEWSKYGCSIMLDGWSDRERRTTINVLVNSSKGTVFMESINASSIKSRFDMSALIDRLVEKIGEANVVQVITDNRSNSVLAGKMLMVIRQNLFWTPCVAHSIDLMLEDIGNIAKVKTTIKRGIFLVGYIYNDYDVLNMMKEFTENKELPRTGITRFVTTYLTLQSLHKQKGSLKNMFTSEKWTKSVWAKEAKGRRASEVVSMPSFWKNVLWTLKVMGPLVRVLRLVKNEKKPAMGYIYKAMDTAKEAIRAAFDKDDKCKAVYDIIDKRWECQLNHPLHAAGYYLNPELYCTDPKIEKDSKVMKGLLECIEKLVPSHAKQELITSELIKWMEQTGPFRDDIAIKTRGKIAPADWWKLYGKETPNLQELAVKVLSLTCNSSFTERKWNAFDHTGSKKSNPLKQRKVKNLVFVQYNLILQNRGKKDAVYDPISLEDIDDCNEWLIGEMEEEPGLETEDLTRVDVANANEDEDEDDWWDEEDFESDGEADLDHFGDNDTDYDDDDDL
ncbi:hypothetical protein SSX86_020537 [Deinandra increscens subsp. villosa]|uniref:BED-type domain-containing protein n=1 Tax=Deinandra increscens subsp. villosa TaxID=3103831 RepID=A0AAP0GQX0_9ASTR